MFKVYKRILGSCLHIPHNGYSLLQQIKTPFLFGGEIPSEMLWGRTLPLTWKPEVREDLALLTPFFTYSRARDLSLGEQWSCRELRTLSEWHKAQDEFTNTLRCLWLSRNECCFAAGNVTGLGVSVAASWQVVLEKGYLRHPASFASKPASLPPSQFSEPPSIFHKIAFLLKLACIVFSQECWRVHFNYKWLLPIPIKSDNWVFLNPDSRVKLFFWNTF